MTRRHRRPAAGTMHVGLNLLFLVPGETGGTEVYARELIAALLEQHSTAIRLTAFVGREAAADTAAPWNEIETVTVPVSSRRRTAWVAGEQLMLPVLAARHGIELMHSLANTAPLLGAYRSVVTIHDLHYRIQPQAHSSLRARGMSVLVPLAARRADRIIVASAATREDLVRLLGTSPAKIAVVPHGVSLPPPATRAEREQMRARLGAGERQIVLSASAKRPHKNLGRLLDALAMIPPARRPLLAIPGYTTAWEPELVARARALGLQADVRFLGWVTTGELEALYACADAAVYPSLHEGFGMPVLEAMARGVPVACSARGSLSEVAQGAALLFDPLDPSAIARSIEQLLAGGPEVSERVSVGRLRAELSTWAQSAHRTLAAYRAVFDPGHG